MSHPHTLRIAYRSPTPTLAAHFETRARLRCRVLVCACFVSQEQCAAELGRPIRTVSRYLNGASRIPADFLLQLEAYALERGVEIAKLVKVAA